MKILWAHSRCLFPNLSSPCGLTLDKCNLRKDEFRFAPAWQEGLMSGAWGSGSHAPIIGRQMTADVQLSHSFLHSSGHRLIGPCCPCRAGLLSLCVPFWTCSWRYPKRFVSMATAKQVKITVKITTSSTHGNNNCLDDKHKRFCPLSSLRRQAPFPPSCNVKYSCTFSV